jgi:predicted NUDIX family NTP pyrophosphohydrolase
MTENCSSGVSMQFRLSRIGTAAVTLGMMIGKKRVVSTTRCVDAISKKARKMEFAGIIMRHDARIFMVQPTGSSGYGIPKGQVEEGETLEEAARREFREETGLEVSGPVKYLEGSGDVKGGKKVHAFVYEGDGSEKFKSSNLITSSFRFGQPENAGGRYLTLEEATSLTHKNQRKLLDLYIASLS